MLTHSDSYRTLRRRRSLSSRVRRWLNRLVMRVYYAARWLMLAVLGAAALALVLGAAGQAK